MGSRAPKLPGPRNIQTVTKAAGARQLHPTTQTGELAQTPPSPSSHPPGTSWAVWGPSCSPSLNPQTLTSGWAAVLSCVIGVSGSPPHRLMANILLTFNGEALFVGLHAGMEGACLPQGLHRAFLTVV